MIDIQIVFCYYHIRRHINTTIYGVGGLKMLTEEQLKEEIKIREEHLKMLEQDMRDCDIEFMQDYLNAYKIVFGMIEAYKHVLSGEVAS
jgi:hypothetical protein